MKIGEVCLLTRDVVRLADFYRRLLGADGAGGDPVHQVILAEETMLTILRDDAADDLGAGRIRLAFTVEDIYAEHSRLIAMGAEILEGPTPRPWGAVNLSFRDPDGNVVYLRSF